MKIKNYHYLIDKSVLRIQAKRRPTVTAYVRSGPWRVKELVNGEWVMPCFPEITWGTLRKAEYLGSALREGE